MTSNVVNPQTETEHADHFLSLSGIMRVSLPLMIGTGIGAVQQCMDRLFLSYLSSEALAASFPAMITHYVLVCFFIASALYVGTFVSQHFGAKEWRQVGAMTWPSLFLALLGSIISIIAIPFLPMIFAWFQSDEIVTVYMIGLCTWYCWGTLPTILMAIWASFFSSIGHTKLVMNLSLLAVLCNVLFNYMFIFGNWGAPELGVVGAAIGTVLAQSLIGFVYAALFFGRKNRERFDLLSQWRMGFRKMKVFLKFATPHGVREIIEILSWHFLFMTVAHFGTVSLAANNIVIGWYFMFFAPLLGIIQSVSIGVGHLVGAGRYDDVPRVLRLHLIIGIIYAGIWLVLFSSMGKVFVAPFIGGDSEEWQAIADTSTTVLLYAGVWGIFDAVQLIMRSAINAAGDVLWTFIATPIAYLLSLVAPCLGLMYIASQEQSTLWGIPLVELAWLVACASLLVLSLVFWYRFRSGQWRTATVRVH